MGWIYLDVLVLDVLDMLELFDIFDDWQCWDKMENTALYLETLTFLYVIKFETVLLTLSYEKQSYKQL